jgi:RNA polymerase sigma-70 factor, ECF subfamily
MPPSEWSAAVPKGDQAARCHLFHACYSVLLKENTAMHVASGAMLDRWTGLSDEDVVARVLQGETALFEVLMRRHNERLYRAARAIVRDGREAEDVMQQAYVNAYTHLRQFDGRARFSTWLTRIAVHEAIARARRRGRYEPLESDTRAVETMMPPTPAADPEQQAFAREIGALLEWAVDRLADGNREVFMLREVEGMSTLETAQVLDVSEDVVKTRLSRAKAALRRDLLERAGMAAGNAFTFHQTRCDRVVAAVFARLGVQ